MFVYLKHELKKTEIGESFTWKLSMKHEST